MSSEVAELQAYIAELKKSLEEEQARSSKLYREHLDLLEKYGFAIGQLKERPPASFWAEVISIIVVIAVLLMIILVLVAKAS